MELGFRDCGPSKCYVGISTALPQPIHEISKVFTHKAWRRRGYASRLLKNICDEANRDFLPLLLMVDNGNEELIKLYSRFQFQVIQTKPVCLMLRYPEGSNG